MPHAAGSGRVAAMLKGNGTIPPEEVKAAFSDIDKDGNGELTLSELMVALKQVTGRQFSRERIEYLMKRWDTDTSGSLDLDEFGQLCHYLASETTANTEIEHVWKYVSNLRMGIDDAPSPESAEDSSGQAWTAVGFVRSIGVARPVAKALLWPAGSPRTTV